MRDAFKSVTKINFGGGFNLLCVAAAGYLTAKTIIKLDEWSNKDEQLKTLKEACEAVKTINEVVDKLEIKKEEC